MRFLLKNIGPIGEAEIDLADLTIICGENNTGKTYVTYAICGFLHYWEVGFTHGVLGNMRQGTIPHENLRFDLKRIFSGKMNDYLRKAADAYTAELPMILGCKPDSNRVSQIEVSVDEPPEFSVRSSRRVLRWGGSPDVAVAIHSEADNGTLTVVMYDEAEHHAWLDYHIAESMTELVASRYFPRVHISCAERTGVAIFRGALASLRDRTSRFRDESISGAAQKNFTMDGMTRGDVCYATPVMYCIDDSLRMEMTAKRQSELSETHPDILRAFGDLIAGDFEVDETGIYYQSHAPGVPRLAMSEASSCVRALVDLGLYLRHKAKVGDLLMIDEPELSLHPNKQRELARLLARLVNAGIKVFLTTHSDYIIKEFNALIMMNQRLEHTIQVQRDEQYDDAELLDPNRVRLYATGRRPGGSGGDEHSAGMETLIPAKIYPDVGIDVPAFDEIILKMNRIQDELLYGGD
ncbi:MAG: AAA family ATPase [Polyangiaceae bacterium]|nr:AAA family ATPase [Polyangiaceae bacterium]